MKGKGRVKEAAGLVAMSAMALRLASHRPRPCHSTTAASSLITHTPPTRLYATPGWMLEASMRFIHIHTSVAIWGVEWEPKS